MNKKGQKWISILLVLFMLMSILPVSGTAFAADGTLTWGEESNGTPYVQWNADKFSYGAFLWVKIIKDGEQLVGTDGAFGVHADTGKLDLTEQIRNGGSGEYVVEISAEGKTLTSAPKSFNFDKQLKKPTLSYNAETVTLSWNDVGADYYRLTIYKDTWNLVFKDERVDGTSIDLSEWIPSAGRYSVTLKAISEDFTCSSSENALTTINKDSTLPEITGLKVNGLWAFWNAVDGATDYFIRVIKVGGDQVVGVRSPGTSFDLNGAVAHKWGGEGTYQIDVTAFKNSVEISNETSVNFDFEFEDLLKFDDQSPEMPSGKTTTWLEYFVDESVQFRFNNYPLVSYWQFAGYGVEKYSRLEGLWGDLMTPVEKTTDVTNAFGCGIIHTFDKPGMYKLTETLRLKDKDGNTVATKTHVFNINVVAKPPVTPTITTQPNDVTNASGDSVTLTATADNATRARWYVEKSDGTVVALGNALTDGTSTQTVSKDDNAVGNRYFCAFWSEDDKIAKTELVTVCFAPTVTTGSAITVNVGQTAYLKVTASGCDHYDTANGWYKGDKDTNTSELKDDSKYYPMGTTLCIKNVTEDDAGAYTYKYVTEHGDVVTGTVELVVNTATLPTEIDSFTIYGLDNPVVMGTKADTEVVSGDNRYTVESVKWTAGVNADGIVNSPNGIVEIKLKANEGYVFKKGELVGSVVDIPKTVYGVADGATEVTVYVDYKASESSWKIAYPENDTISISTDSLTFKADTAANGQKVEGTFNCTHKDLADTDLHHTGMKYAVYSGIADNEMPAGLTLNADGTITGTPTTAGVYTVMVRADSVNASGTASNCSGLAVKAIEIVVEDKDAHTHDTAVVSDTATCTTDGVMTLKCGCTADSPAKGHDWGEWNDGYPIITPPCTADSDLVITRTCANDASHTESKTISRIHMAMDWSTDDNYHWKVCVYCNNALVVEPESHTDANSDNQCDVCGYEMASGGGEGGDVTYTVTFDANGGSAVDAQTVKEGEKATKPADPTRSGYRFQGWTLNGAAYDFSQAVTGDIILEATWKKKSSGGSYYGGGSVGVTPDKDDDKWRMVLKIDSCVITVNDKTFMNDVPPVLVGDRTLVPIRVITEQLGGTADWNNDTREVTLRINDKVLTMTIDQAIPGFGAAPTIMNDRTYVPVRYVMEYLGAQVDWISDTQQIVIEK